MGGKKLVPELWLPYRIWNLMSLQQIKPQGEQIFSDMRRVMLAIWITHWNCIKQQKEWSERAAYNMHETIINHHQA
jgi:hypothetical protein